ENRDKPLQPVRPMPRDNRLLSSAYSPVMSCTKRPDFRSELLLKLFCPIWLYTNTLSVSCPYNCIRKRRIPISQPPSLGWSKIVVPGLYSCCRSHTRDKSVPFR